MPTLVSLHGQFNITQHVLNSLSTCLRKCTANTPCHLISIRHCHLLLPRRKSFFAQAGWEPAGGGLAASFSQPFPRFRRRLAFSKATSAGWPIRGDRHPRAARIECTPQRDVAKRRVHKRAFHRRWHRTAGLPEK